MTDKEIDEMWVAFYRQEHYLLPYSSGEFMVYHHAAPRASHQYGVDPNAHYEIIRPKKFRLKLFYEDNLVKIAKDVVPRVWVPYKNPFVEIPTQIKLEDYFEIKEWRGRKIPIALKRFETEYKVERLFSLLIFS